MKKYIFLPIAALALGFAACEDDDTLGIPVVNPEIPAVDPSIVTVAASAEVADVISLETYNNNDQDIPVAIISAGEEWPEGYDFGAVVQLATTEDFNNPYEFAATVSGKNIMINPEIVQGFIRENVTKAPVVQNLWIRFGMQAVNGKEVIRLGGADSYIGTEVIKVLPFTLAVIEPVYYLIYSDDAETWTPEHAVKLSHGDRNQYDDPTFSVICNLGEEAYWKILPESTYKVFKETSAFGDGLVIGVTEEDSESRSGKLDESADALAGYIDVAGSIYFEVNLDRAGALTEEKDAMTFSYKEAVEYLWLAGDNLNGITWGFSEQPNLWTTNYSDYIGYAVFGSLFKFSPTNGWNGDFGSQEDATFTTKDNGEYVGTGVANGGNNINVGQPGLYFISLNYLTKEFSMTLIETYGIIGGFNGWDKSVPMTVSDNGLTFTVTQAMTAGTEWKFRANNQWSVNLGGDVDNLTPDGSNIVCNEDGVYEITLHLENIPWTATIVKK